MRVGSARGDALRWLDDGRVLPTVRAGPPNRARQGGVTANAEVCAGADGLWQTFGSGGRSWKCLCSS